MRILTAGIALSGLVFLTTPMPRLGDLWVPGISSTSCDQAIFVDHATDLRVPSDTVLLKVDGFG